jgi:hypothetical protein
MEPRHNESAAPDRALEQHKKQKGRFQIVKLEERIAPNKGGVPAVTKDRNCYGQHH